MQLDNNCVYVCLLGKHALWTAAAGNQCFPSQVDMTTSGDVEATDILRDSNHSTCLRLVNVTGTRLSILISLSPYRAISNIHVLGNSLTCSPRAGMMLSSIYGCHRGTCAAMCAAGDFFMAGMRTGCRYKCHCLGQTCHAILLDVLRLSNTIDQWEICEIII